MMRGIIAFSLIEEPVSKSLTKSPAIMYYCGDANEEAIVEALKSDDAFIEWAKPKITLANYEKLYIYYTTYFTEDDKDATSENTTHGSIKADSVVYVDNVADVLLRIALHEAMSRPVEDDPIQSVKTLLGMGLTLPTITNGIRAACQKSGLKKEYINLLIKKIQNVQ